MKVCTTYGSAIPLRKGAEMHEIRLDVFDRIPDGVGEESLVTLCGKDPSVVPASFGGLVDVGERDIDTVQRRIRSFHDFERTPSADEIVRMLSEGDQYISKGAFKASSFTDLNSLLEASKRLDRRHVLLCMGEIGMVTRLRQKILHNEFTFGYEGVSTAPGQFSADEMEELGDDCYIVGITGHPLGHTLSPPMQNAAMRKSGINGRYLVFDSPDLNHMKDAIVGYNIRGLNVTIPYKQDVMSQLDSVSEEAEGAGAVNTIVNDDGKLTGHNTDITGIEYALRDSELKGSKALIMGSGGAARAAAFTLGRAGCEVSIAGRNSSTVEGLCKEFGSHPFKGSAAGFDVVVNCTPIGLVEGQYPADISDLNKEQTVFDMVYGRDTPLTSAAKKFGCRIADGKDMLIGQGAQSFRLWFGKEPDMEAMRGAIQ